MQTVSCTTCSKAIPVSDIKYWTADNKNVFCDAECSTKWFATNVLNKENNDTNR